MSLRLLLVAALAGLVFVPGAGIRGQEKKHDHKTQEPCAKACSDCALECAACNRHCFDLATGGDKKHALVARLCQDCADVCALTGKVVGRRGPVWPAMCEACARVCKACAEQCGKFPDHEQMKKCAKACSDCEKACRVHLATRKK
jgi:hypothetical protein